MERIERIEREAALLLQEPEAVVVGGRFDGVKGRTISIGMTDAWSPHKLFLYLDLGKNQGGHPRVCAFRYPDEVRFAVQPVPVTLRYDAIRPRGDHEGSPARIEMNRFIQRIKQGFCPQAVGQFDAAGHLWWVAVRDPHPEDPSRQLTLLFRRGEFVPEDPTLLSHLPRNPGEAYRAAEKRLREEEAASTMNAWTSPTP